MKKEEDLVVDSENEIFGAHQNLSTWEFKKKNICGIALYLNFK
jgi:hypothetical protein